MLRRSLLASVLVTAALAAGVACSGSSSRSSGGNARYPRRAPGCPLQIYNGLPEVKAYDDIGMVQADCYLDESEVVCLSRLRTEACRMGGDIVYNLPKKASRPVERGMVYRAQVAHTRDAKKQDDASVPSATSTAPVEPLLAAPGVVPKPASADGGAP
jgi:hypothetical protein